MPVAYFDAEGLCVGVSDLPVPVPTGGSSCHVPAGTDPNCIYLDDGVLAQSLPSSLGVPETLEAPGPGLELELPAGVLAIVDGQEQRDTLVVPAEAEGSVIVQLRGRMTGTHHIQIHTYASRRRGAYPSIADQLDALWKGDTDQMRETVMAVKTEYPKPETD